MLGKIVRFLCYLDDLAEVLVFHVLFSKANWKKAVIGAAALVGLVLSQLTWAPQPHAKTPRTKAAKAVQTVSAKELSERGYELLLKGRTKAAVASMEAAVAMEPGNPLFQQRLGLGYLETGKNELAKDALDRSWRLHHSRTTLFYLGCAYQSLKMHDVAIGMFNQVKSTSLKDVSMPESALAYEPVAQAKIGECYVRQGQFDRAIEVLNRNVADYPNYPHSYFYLGIAHWDRGNPDLGVEQMFKVIELYPEESAAYYNVACYYAIKGIPDLAMVWLEKALKNGFSQFSHMRTDKDMDSLRNLPAYKSLVSKFEKMRARAE